MTLAGTQHGRWSPSDVCEYGLGQFKLNKDHHSFVQEVNQTGAFLLNKGTGLQAGTCLFRGMSK